MDAPYRCLFARGKKADVNINKVLPEAVSSEFGALTDGNTVLFCILVGGCRHMNLDGISACIILDRSESSFGLMLLLAKSSNELSH